ncbi:transcriptional regulatory protein Pho23p [[Candida] anglica]
MSNYQDLPSRQKSQRLINKMKSSKVQQFNRYKQRARNITNATELLPGLNDISDAFEALPLDIIKYFTLLKEIDAKCINSVPQINNSIKNYIDCLHESNPEVEKLTKQSKIKRLTNIRDKIHEIIPCLEEKMHVTSVATDSLHKHMFRINNDYKLILNNNEIPEAIRIGPLNHPAMIMDSSSPSDHSNPNRSAQSQRSESRREALAAKKANKDSGYEDDEPNTGNSNGNGSTNSSSATVGKKKKTSNNNNNNNTNGNKDGSPATDAVPSVGGPITGTKVGTNNNVGAPSKKRPRKEQEEISRPGTPNGGVGSNGSKKRATKPKKEDQSAISETPHGNASTQNNEPTYCYCNQVSFGEMVGCDGDDCKREWFHLPCIGFKNPPKGKWYCDECLVKMKKTKKI